MACVKGKSICETCGIEFDWRKHDSQPDRKFCTRKCTNKNFGVLGNKDRLFWPIATEVQKKEKLKIIYEEKVIKKEGCWDWDGYFDKNGYAQINGHNGKRFVPVKAHRISYEIHKGKIENKMLVLHRCDNPRCTNPEHLWLGTHKDNTQDMLNKNRQKGFR